VRLVREQENFMVSNSFQHPQRASRLRAIFFSVLAAASLALTVSACGGFAYRGALVYDAPPPPRVYVRPVLPAAGHVWIDGYWNRNGGSWAWRNGYWTAPRAGYVHVQPRWTREGRGWRQQEGGWRTRGSVRVNSRSRRESSGRGAVRVNPGRGGGAQRGGGSVRVR